MKVLRFLLVCATLAALMLGLMLVFLSATVHAQDPRATGTITAGGQSVTLMNLVGKDSVAIQVGTSTAGTPIDMALICEVSTNNTKWDQVPVWSSVNPIPGSAPIGGMQVSISWEGLFSCDLGGARSVRVYSSSFTSGSVAVTINAGAGGGTLFKYGGDYWNPFHAKVSSTMFDAANVQPPAIGEGYVYVAGLPLPTGAATETTLAALNAKVPASPATDRATAAAPGAARLSDGSSFYKATTPSDTQPVSAAALPLPSGAAVVQAGTLAATTTAAALGASTVIGSVLVQNDAAVDVLCGNATVQPFRLVPGAVFSMDVGNLNLIFCKIVSSTGNVNYVAR